MTKSHHQEKPRSAQTPNGHVFLAMTERFRPLGLWPEAYNPEAYNFVAMLGFFREPIKIYFLIWNYW